VISSLFKKSGVFSYLFSIAILILAVYSKGEIEGSFISVDFKKNVTFVVLCLCMLAVDWTVKQHYWATTANYHLLLFPVFILALPVELWDNWVLFFFFFLWIAFGYLIAIDQSGRNIAKVFNAFFFYFTGCLFFSQGIIFLPILWFVLMLKGGLNLRVIVISLLPLLALFLLEIMIIYVFPQSRLIPEISFSSLVFSFSWESLLRLNLWLGILLVLLLFSVIKHYIDMGTKSASYGSGMIALFALAFTALLFTVLFQTQNSFSWVIFIMALMALSTRFFEDMKRAWLRELLFFGIIGLLLLSKYGFPF
jgi:hypothetical protein